MKKTLLATAVAAAMAPGLVAADVKIFGTIQAEHGNIDIDRRGAGADTDTNHNGGGSGAINGGGSNAFGVKGTEKLGNGMSVYFKLNHSFATFDGAPADDLAARDRFVGIKGDGWHAQVGKMNISYKETSIGYDPFVATGLQARAVGGVSGLHNGYGDDLLEVGFKSGSLGGEIQVKMEDATGASNTAGGARNNIDAGSWNAKIVYGGKGWEIGLAHADLSYDSTAGAGSTGSMDATKISGKWSGNGFTIMAHYENLDANNRAATNVVDKFDSGTATGTNMASNAAGTTNASSHAEEYDSFLIGMKYKMTDSTSLIARYTDSSWDDVAGVAGDDVNADGWAIGVVHSLSKRTHVYGGFMNNDFDGKGTLTDTDVDAWGIGMRHKF